jgi:sugar phosphate isomerase/epimerase
MINDDISLAQWALVEEIRAGQWKTTDFPAIARNDFNLNGIELVNTLFDVPTHTYLQQLKQNAADHGITMVLVMVDDEGDGCCTDPRDRRQFAINHRKWIDIARYLGCHAIRTNCRGEPGMSGDEALNYAADSYHMLLEYAGQAGISVLIENHGGISNDPEFMVALMNKVNHPLFGTYPDWREPAPDFDNFEYLRKTLPYAKGMSYRNQPAEESTARMINLCKQSGYKGWYGIESDGRDAVHEGIRLLKKYLFNG